VTVRIVADTACDLPDDLANELGIVFVPLHVRFGTTELLDREQLSAKEFWARCASSPELPETAAPSPGAFSAAFESLASAGADGVVCVTLSSKLSATSEAAAQAARSIGGDFPVEVIDSFSVTMGEGFVAQAAAEAAAAGAGMAEVVAVANSTRGRLSVLVQSTRWRTCARVGASAVPPRCWGHCWPSSPLSRYAMARSSRSPSSARVQSRSGTWRKRSGRPARSSA